MDVKATAARAETALNAATAPDFASIMADLASLRQDVGVLANHLAQSATSSASAAGDEMRAGATRLYDGMSEASKTSAKAVTAQMDAHPAMSLLLAFLLGFLGSRFLSR